MIKKIISEVILNDYNMTDRSSFYMFMDYIINRRVKVDMVDDPFVFLDKCNSLSSDASVLFSSTQLAFVFNS